MNPTFNPHSNETVWLCEYPHQLRAVAHYYVHAWDVRNHNHRYTCGTHLSRAIQEVSTRAVVETRRYDFDRR